MSSKFENIAHVAVPAILFTGITTAAIAEPKDLARSKDVSEPTAVDPKNDEVIQPDYFEEFINFLGLSSRVTERQKPVEGTTNCLACNASL